MRAWIIFGAWVAVVWLVVGCLVMPWAVHLLTDDSDDAEAEGEE